MFLPLMFVGMGFPGLQTPDARVMRALSVLPGTSPTVMTARLVLSDVAAWEVLVAIGLMVLADFVFAPRRRQNLCREHFADRQGIVLARALARAEAGLAQFNAIRTLEYHDHSISERRMPRPEQTRIAVLGAGPIGLDAALTARMLGFPVTVYERGRVAEYVQRWGHAKFFSRLAR